MPIRVEHGPSMPLVGQLAYQTGQLQYRNKRRSELEALAMQQAEMRQRAQMQQNQIAASLRGQKMTQMGAMQRLQMQQQYGQVNADQAFQRQLQLAEDSRNHSLNLSKQYGQNAIDSAQLAHGLASKRDLNRIRWNQTVSDYDNILNSAGKQEQLSLFQRRVGMENDDRIPPDQLQGKLDELDQQIVGLADNPLYRIGREKEPGYSEEYGIADDGVNYTHLRTRNAEGIWEYEPNLVRRTQITDDQGQEQWVEDKINQADWQHDSVKISRRDGQMIITQPDPYSNRLTTRVVDDPNVKLEQDAAEAAQKEADADKKARDDHYRQQEELRRERVQDEGESFDTMPHEWHSNRPFIEIPSDIESLRPPPEPHDFTPEDRPIKLGQGTPAEAQSFIDKGYVPMRLESGDLWMVPPNKVEEVRGRLQERGINEIGGGGQPGAGMRGLGGGGAPAAPIAPQAPAAGPAQAMGNPSNPWPPEQAHLAKVGDMMIPAPGVPPMVKEF